MLISRSSKSLLALTLLAALPVASHASIILEERSSALQVFYIYGGGDNQFPGSNSVGSIELNSDYSLSMSGSEQNSGNTEFGPWEAGISYNLSQQWAETATGFTGAADTVLNSFEEGMGSSRIESNAPGNELILSFTNTTATDFKLSGSLGREALVTLEKFDGFVWNPVYTAANVGGFTMSSFNTVGHIDVGQYRLFANAFTTAAGDQFSQTSYNFDFQAVPEPATMAALGLAIAAMIRRRRKA